MYVRILGGHRTAVVPFPRADFCTNRNPPALANGEAAWSKYFNFCGLLECNWKVVGISANPKHRRFSYSVSAHCVGYPNDCDSSTGTDPIVQGAGSVLVYNADADGAHEQVDVLVGGRPRPLFAVNGIIQGLAVGGGAIETLNLVCSASCGTRSGGSQTHSASGKRLAPMPSLPALAGNVAGVPTILAGGVDQITLFNATTGTQLAQLTVGHAINGFSLVGGDAHWLVFHIGRAISALNVDSQQIVLLTTTAPNPVDISVSGQRVAWAENINGHGRIRALVLPS